MEHAATDSSIFVASMVREMLVGSDFECVDRADGVWRLDELT